MSTQIINLPPGPVNLSDCTVRATQVRALTNASSAIGAITGNIDGYIRSIDGATDCETLRELLDQTSRQLSTQINSTTSQITSIGQKFLPIVKLPKSFKKIIGWAKKLVVGTVAPQLTAYIELTNQLIELSAAASRFTATVGQVASRLERCAIDAIDDQIYGLQNQLNTSINSVIIRLTNNINTELCDLGPQLTVLGATLGQAATNTQVLLSSASSLSVQADAAIDSTLNTINDIGTSLEQIAPITFTIDTSTKQGFQDSLALGALDAFNQSTDSYLSSDAPINTTEPSVSGTPSAIGQTLTVDPGVWEGEDIVYTYQWYRNGLPIKNATGSIYVLAGSDGNSSTIYCEVTATNAGGEDAVETVPVTTTFVTGGLFIYGQRI